MNCAADLARARLAVMESLAHGAHRRVQAAVERVTLCMRHLVAAALALDRVLVERGDEDGRRQLVESALRLTANV